MATELNLLQKLFISTQCEMRAIASKNTNQIYNLASKFSDSLHPFFFVKKTQHVSMPDLSNFTLKVNRQMTPLLTSLPQQARLAFWSLPQIQVTQISPKTFQNSMILNPFKTENFITASLMRGIRKMMVSDVQQLTKIQNCYFKLLKQGKRVKEPEYIWAVEDKNQGLQNVIGLKNCDIPIGGYYFTKELNLNQIKSFLNNTKIQNSLPKFRQVKVQNLEQEKDTLIKQNIQPMIINYSQINDYLMVCRVIGKEKTGKPIFEDKCLDFICKGDICSCSNASPKILDIFKTHNQEWAIVNPVRLDKLEQNFVVQND